MAAAAVEHPQPSLLCGRVFDLGLGGGDCGFGVECAVVSGASWSGVARYALRRCQGGELREGQAIVCRLIGGDRGAVWAEPAQAEGGPPPRPPLGEAAPSPPPPPPPPGEAVVRRRRGAGERRAVANQRGADFARSPPPRLPPAEATPPPQLLLPGEAAPSLLPLGEAAPPLPPPPGEAAVRRRRGTGERTVVAAERGQDVARRADWGASHKGLG